MSTLKRLQWVRRTHRKVPAVWIFTSYLAPPGRRIPTYPRQMAAQAKRLVDGRVESVDGVRLTGRTRYDRYLPWAAKGIRRPLDIAVAAAREQVGKFDYDEILDVHGLPMGPDAFENAEARDQIEWGPGMTKVLALRPQLRDALLATFVHQLQDVEWTMFDTLKNHFDQIIDWSEQTGTPLEGMTILEAKFASDVWHEELKAAAKSDMDVEQGEVILRWDDGYTAQRLSTKRQLEHEGEAMGHCVGGYFEAVDAGRTDILSIRDSKGRPHVTVELNFRAHWAVNQCRGKGNDYPTQRYCQYVVGLLEHLEIAEEDWDEAVACIPPHRLVDRWRLRSLRRSEGGQAISLYDGSEVILAPADAVRFLPTEDLPDESPQGAVVDMMQTVSGLEEGWDDGPGGFELGIADGDLFFLFGMSGDDVSHEVVDDPARFRAFLLELGHGPALTRIEGRLGIDLSRTQDPIEWGRAGTYSTRRFLKRLANQIVAGNPAGELSAIWRYTIPTWSPSWVDEMQTILDEVKVRRDNAGSKAEALTGGSEYPPNMLSDDWKEQIADAVREAEGWKKAQIA